MRLFLRTVLRNKGNQGCEEGTYPKGVSLENYSWISYIKHLAVLNTRIDCVEYNEGSHNVPGKSAAR